MKLHEILEHNDLGHDILIEKLIPYKRSLITIFESHNYSQAILMVTSVMNAAQYGQIVMSDGLSDAVDEYVNSDDTLTEEEKENEKETILFNSIPLHEL